MAQQTLALYTVSSGDRVERARTRLAEELGTTLGEPDGAGVVSVELDADSGEDAEQRLRDALAKTGTSDDFVISQTTEGREVPPDDPRQPGAGIDADTSTTTVAGPNPPASNAGQAAGGGGSEDAGRAAAMAAAVPSAAKYALPAIVSGLIVLVLLRKRRG